MSERPQTRTRCVTLRVGQESPAERHVPGPGGVTVPGIEVASTYWTRLRGMLWRHVLPPGLLLLPGGSVHGVGMTVSLDVALLAPVGERSDPVAGPYRVVRTAVLRPFGLVGSARGVRAVLEAPAGSFERWGLEGGSVVSFEPPQP